MLGVRGPCQGRKGKKEGRSDRLHKEAVVPAPFSSRSPPQAAEKAHQLPDQRLQLILKKHSEDYIQTAKCMDKLWPTKNLSHHQINGNCAPKFAAMLDQFGPVKL